MSQDFNTQPETLDVNIGAFRPGKDFLPHELMFMVEATPIANFLTYGMVNEAFQNGITLLDANDEELSNNDELQKDPRWKPMIEAVKNGMSEKRAYGWSTLAVVERNGEDVIRWFGSQRLDHGAYVTYKISKDIEITEMNFSLRSQGGVINFTYTGKQIEDDTYIIMDERAELFKGKSYLEPIWINIWISFIIDWQSGLYSQRVGGGIQVVEVPPEFFNDEPEMKKARAEMEAGLTVTGDRTIFIFASSENFKTKYQLYTGEGQINFKEINDIQMLRISSYTGVPREKWEGNNIAKGASDQNASYYNTQKEGLQEEGIPILQWAIKAIFDVDVPGIRFNIFKELDEKKVIESKKEKLEALNIIADKLDKLGLNVEQVMKWLDIDMEVDTSLIEKTNSENEAFKEMLTEAPKDDTLDTSEEEHSNSE